MIIDTSSYNLIQSYREQLTSYLISKSTINIRWKKNVSEKKTTGKIVAADQGMKDVLSCSDKQTTPKKDQHGHRLESILKKLAFKKKGSKAFKKAQAHRAK
jgi:transposase